MLEGSWQGPEGSPGRLDTCGHAEVQEAGGFGGLCQSPSRGTHSPFSGRSVFQTQQSRSGQLREPSVTAWAHQFSGLTEIRDIKEVVTLSEVLDAVNRREIAQAMDIVCQRILAIQAAKTKGGSWEKAEAIEHAGVDQCLSEGFRRAWYSLGGHLLGACTFQRYYSVMTKALTICLNQRGDAGSLHSCMWLLQRTLKLPSLMREFKYSGGPKGRNQGKSPSQVFPLPPLSRSGSLVTGVGDEADVDNLCAYYGGNMVVAALNWMHGERVERFDILSAAHGRVHSRIERILRAFVMTDMPILDHEVLVSYLRQTQCYTGAGVVLALGVKGGVPSKAADVTLAKHLGNMYPEMGEQVVNPRSLLLPSKRRPKKLRRGYTWLSPSYPELVKGM